jgi:primase-polymerase (primpol)-like protein
LILILSFLQERKLNKITIKLPDTSKQVANIILQDGGGSIFISSGYHTPYVLLDQIPPVKYVQPNNYNELIFANNFNINIEDLVKEIESKKIKYIQWCDDFLPEDVLQGKNIYSDKINFSYYTLISKLISNKYYLLGSIKPNCSIFKHQ